MTSIRCCWTRPGRLRYGNRQATEFKPLRGVTEQELADAAQLASLADETPEGRSIVVLAKEKYGIRGRELAEMQARFIPFSAQTRMSGVEVGSVLGAQRSGRSDPQLPHPAACRGRCRRGGAGAAAERQRRDGA